jgi:hypothetical protein
MPKNKNGYFKSYTLKNRLSPEKLNGMSTSGPVEKWNEADFTHKGKRKHPFPKLIGIKLELGYKFFFKNPHI